MSFKVISLEFSVSLECLDLPYHVYTLLNVFIAHVKG